LYNWISDAENKIEMKDGKLEKISVELLMIADKKYDRIPNIISTCGFYVTKTKWQY
jgi:antitoxin YqcF